MANKTIKTKSQTLPPDRDLLEADPTRYYELLSEWHITKSEHQAGGQKAPEGVPADILLDARPPLLAVTGERPRQGYAAASCVRCGNSGYTQWTHYGKGAELWCYNGHMLAHWQRNGKQRDKTAQRALDALSGTRNGKPTPAAIPAPSRRNGPKCAEPALDHPHGTQLALAI